MKQENRTPAFATYFVEAERILKKSSVKPTELQQGAYILFHSYESILREILSDLQIYDGDMWSLNRITNEVIAQCEIPTDIVQGLRELIEHRNMVAHAIFTANVTGDVLLVDLEKVRSFAVWYLRDFPNGPKYETEKIAEFLRGDEFPAPKKVFISYARENENSASSLYDTLRDHRHRPWMDKRDLIAGQEWKIEIRKAIEKSDYFIALMSSKSVTKRGFIQKEIRFALEVLGEMPPGRIYFIPVRLEPCEVPDIIKHLHWIDLPNDKSYNQIIRAIEHG